MTPTWGQRFKAAGERVRWGKKPFTAGDEAAAGYWPKDPFSERDFRRSKLNPNQPAAESLRALGFGFNHAVIAQDFGRASRIFKEIQRRTKPRRR